MKLDYVASPDKLKLTQEMRLLMWRRTAPFLDRAGMNNSVQHLLEEAYLQGMKDACAAFVERQDK
jgi:hypothetical protein